MKSDIVATDVVIVGGGFSGTMMAAQLARRGLASLLVEGGGRAGRGTAYSTREPAHLLNVAAEMMSAWADEPDHFVAAGNEPGAYAPRRDFGAYLRAILDEAVVSGKVEVAEAQAVSAVRADDCWSVKLDDGRAIRASALVLANGNQPPEPMRVGDGISPGLFINNPWREEAQAAIARTAASGDDVLILGTGLTMVDYVQSVVQDGHRGPIVAMSRRGLLTKPHRRVDPIRIDEADVPFGAGISHLLRWFRSRVGAHVAQGGDWRSVIDGLRPYTQRLWRELPPASKRRFLEHARAWWDVHRHRMAPEVEARITDALCAGRLNVVAAKVAGIEPNEAGARIRYRRRGQSEVLSMQVGAIVDCTGIVKDPLASANPAVRSLFERGLARVDPLHIGIETAADGAIVNQDGATSRRLFAVGPLTRAAFWEIIAIPDIRNQCAELAAKLAHVDEASLAELIAARSA